MCPMQKGEGPIRHIFTKFSFDKDVWEVYLKDLDVSYCLPYQVIDFFRGRDQRYTRNFTYKKSLLNLYRGIPKYIKLENMVG